MAESENEKQKRQKNQCIELSDPTLMRNAAQAS